MARQRASRLVSQPTLATSLEVDDRLIVAEEGEEHYDQPTVDTVLQAEDEEGIEVPVRMVAPVQVDELPSTLGGVRTYGLDASIRSATKLCNDDPRRKAITILSPDGDVWLAGSPSEVETGAGFLLGANVPLTLGVHDELWVIPVATVGLHRVSALIEQWAR